MSSTNRTDARDKHIADYYITPQKCIKEFLNVWLVDVEKDDRQIAEREVFLDPCAGGDKEHEMSYPTVIKEMFGVDTITIDIREDSLSMIKADYLSYEMFEPKPTIIITNPPFNQAQEIIKKALNDVADGGYVIMLLRLNYFGSNDRFPFWEENMPKYVYVHHRRMSFTDNGKTDSIEYMHAVWRKGEKSESALLKVI